MTAQVSFGIITVKADGSRWRVVRAINASEAWRSISYARARGCNGVTDMDTFYSASPKGGYSRVLAKVERIRPAPQQGDAPK